MSHTRDYKPLPQYKASRPQGYADEKTQKHESKHSRNESKTVLGSAGNKGKPSGSDRLFRKASGDKDPNISTRDAASERPEGKLGSTHNSDKDKQIDKDKRSNFKFRDDSKKRDGGSSQARQAQSNGAH